jgi:hypothetical protein
VAAVIAGLTCLIATASPSAYAASGAPDTFVLWGDSGVQQADAPTGLSGVTSISAGGDQVLALKSDGTFAEWGGAGSPSQGDCEGGAECMPPGLNQVAAVSAGWGFSLALKPDGTVVAWGTDDRGQVDVPAGLANVTAISAGYNHSLAVKSDGSVTGWGDNTYGELNVPAGLSNVVAVTAGAGQSMALRSDGTVAAWGDNTYGQGTVPPGLDHVTAISAGKWGFDLALKSDGTVVAWGQDYSGQTDVPAGLNNVVAISAGAGYSLALKSDGTVVAWGDGGGVGLTSVPAGLDHVAAIAAGGGDAIAMVTLPAYISLVDGRPSLIAHWRLGEKSGSTARDTTGTYNGTYTGSPTLGLPGAVTNDPDTAAGFNGSTSKVSVPAIPATVDFTVEGWTYLTNCSAANNTLYGTYGTVRILIRCPPTSSATAYAGVWLNGTEYVLQPYGGPTNQNTWVHWVLTRHANVLTLYRNGAQIGQRTDLPATAPASLNGAIGMQANGNYPLTGRTDEVALYSSALSATDVADDYQAALTGPPPPPPSSPSYKSAVLGEVSVISYWRLDEASGTTAADSKGTNNGTYSNVSRGLAGAITNDPDTAAGFNGSTSKVSLPSLGTAGDFTIEGWTYLTNSSTTNNTLYGAGGAVRLLARPGSATAAYAGIWLNGTEYALQPKSPASNLNTWVYWALTRKGNTLTLYRNGVQIGQRTDLPAAAPATIKGSIGAQGGSTYFLTGSTDDVAIYNAALSSAAITSHYTAALNGPPPS